MCVCVCVCKAYLKTSGSGVTRCKYKKKKEKKNKSKMDQGKKTNPRAKYRTPDLRPQHGQQLRRGFWFRVVSTTTTNMAMRFGKKKKKVLQA